MITAIYHVTVTMPHEIYHYFDGEESFERTFHEATAHAIESGVNLYDKDPEFYASYHDLSQAQRCESSLNDLVADFTRQHASLVEDEE